MMLRLAGVTAVLLLAPAVSTPVAGADDAPPCTAEQLVVTALPMQAAVTHRGVPLVFALVPGAPACTLTGYPGVDSGAGGPLLHAQRTLRGYLGGAPAGVDTPPTVTVTPGHPAQAMVEGIAVDHDGVQCPSYTSLLVTPPDTAGTVTLDTTIDTCHLQVHPVTSS